LSIIIVDQLEG